MLPHCSDVAVFNYVLRNPRSRELQNVELTWEISPGLPILIDCVFLFIYLRNPRDENKATDLGKV